MEETAMDEMVHHNNLIHVGKNLNEKAVSAIKSNSLREIL
jgi:hypothetical protein